MSQGDRIEGFLDGRNLTPEQWGELKHDVISRAHEARAQLLHDFVAWVLTGAITTARRWTAAYKARRERRTAIHELNALDPRMLRDIGIGRSEIEYLVSHPDPTRLPRGSLRIARGQCRQPGPTAEPARKRTLEKYAA